MKGSHWSKHFIEYHNYRCDLYKDLTCNLCYSIEIWITPNDESLADLNCVSCKLGLNLKCFNFNILSAALSFSFLCIENLFFFHVIKKWIFLWSWTFSKFVKIKKVNKKKTISGSSRFDLRSFKGYTGTTY